MGRTLVEMMKEQAMAMLHNMKTAIHTCDMDFALCGMPVWKHIYHTLHSCDQWFWNPDAPFEEPSFHTEGLNSLDVHSDTLISRDTLLAYLEAIRQKLETGFQNLSDDMLSEKPEGCPLARITLMIGQMRHFHVHLGNINATTMMQKGVWPRVVGLEDAVGDSLYE